MAEREHVNQGDGVGLRALITGVTGQDGSYLAEFLLQKGYQVFGVVRRSSSLNRQRIEHLSQYGLHNPNFHLMYGDMNDSSALNRIIEKVQPTEIYNLAAQSHVGISFEIPEYTADVTGVGVVRLLDAIRNVGAATKFYQASSSELYGKVVEVPQSETTPFMPRSPYACAKAYAYYITKNYREAYGMFACNGILFNHESPRRGENFVSRKITLSLARIQHGLQTQLALGNLDAKRDWGFAKDYVEAMWLMLQRDVPDDYVVATGALRSVREFVEMSAKHIDMDIVWRGQGLEEQGIDRATNRVIVTVDAKQMRPAEVDLLIGDASKAKRDLGWTASTSLPQLVAMMMEHDLRLAHEEAALAKLRQ